VLCDQLRDRACHVEQRQLASDIASVTAPLLLVMMCFARHHQPPPERTTDAANNNDATPAMMIIDQCISAAVRCLSACDTAGSVRRGIRLTPRRGRF